MEKQDILNKIRRLAEANSGIPPGQQKFANETGLAESKWRGVYWTKWSEALREAGFTPHAYNIAQPPEQILSKLAGLVRKKGRFPTSAEMRLEKKLDLDFPWHNTITRLGNKETLTAKLREFCTKHDSYQDLVQLLSPVSENANQEPLNSYRQAAERGCVYLLRSGKFFKIGCTNDIGRRSYELRIQLPEKSKLIHEIKTDDPKGIEFYWHRRFADKRANGEWFSLSQDDIAAFKRRKFM